VRRPTEEVRVGRGEAVLIEIPEVTDQSEVDLRHVGPHEDDALAGLEAAPPDRRRRRRLRLHARDSLDVRRRFRTHVRAPVKLDLESPDALVELAAHAEKLL